jgi:hypothetical protein
LMLKLQEIPSKSGGGAYQSFLLKVCLMFEECI